MHKRVLIAETSDTIRGVAEALLRQNSYEVISVTSGDQVLEVLQFTKPDMLLMSSDMTCKGSKLLYDEVLSDSRFASIPQLVMAPADDSSLPLPPEMIVTKPFEPKELISRIKTFVGQGDQVSQPAAAAKSQSQAQQGGMGEVDDALLDMALGIDQLEVTDSEVMDQTTGIKLKSKKTVEKLIGFDSSDPDTEKNGDSGKVESLMIRDDDTSMSGKQQANESGTGKLEILNDQFGLIDNDHLSPTPTKSDHDYEWFLNELQNDGESSSKTATHNPSVPKHTINESQELEFTDNASLVDPVTPVKPLKASNNQGSSVDSFIDEFKKEIEKIGTDMPESVTINDTKQQAHAKQPMSWEDHIERITPDQIALFKQQFVGQLAQKIAVLIADKIDSAKLLTLLKQEIIKKAKEQ